MPLIGAKRLPWGLGPTSTRDALADKMGLTKNERVFEKAIF